MPRFNIWFVLGIAYIIGMTAWALGNVGKMSGPSEPFTWGLPISMLGILVVPFLLGWLAGKDED
jgi:hypothetical protein